MVANFWQIIMEFDLDSGRLAQKVQELDYEINAGRILLAFQGVQKRLLFFLSRSGDHPISCEMGTRAVILGKIGRSMRIAILFHVTS
jgi:hypothetical protein